MKDRFCKLVNPVNKDESDLIYRITNYNEHTSRIYITPINGSLRIASEELVSVNDVQLLKSMEV